MRPGRTLLFGEVRARPQARQRQPNIYGQPSLSTNTKFLNTNANYSYRNREVKTAKCLISAKSRNILPRNFSAIRYYICSYSKLFWTTSFQLDGITFILSPVAPFMGLDGTASVVPSVGPDGIFAPLWWMSLPHLSIGTMQELVQPRLSTVIFRKSCNYLESFQNSCNIFWHNTLQENVQWLVEDLAVIQHACIVKSLAICAILTTCLMLHTQPNN